MSTDLLVQIYVFVLALFVGFEVITKVPPTLHTPLMSGSNAISGVTLVGAIIAAGSIDIQLSGLWDSLTVTSILGFVAIILRQLMLLAVFL